MKKLYSFMVTNVLNDSSLHKLLVIFKLAMWHLIGHLSIKDEAGRLMIRKLNLSINKIFEQIQ